MAIIDYEARGAIPGFREYHDKLILSPVIQELKSGALAAHGGSTQANEYESIQVG
jgi:hypothetical protein